MLGVKADRADQFETKPCGRVIRNHYGDFLKGEGVRCFGKKR